MAGGTTWLCASAAALRFVLLSVVLGASISTGRGQGLPSYLARFPAFAPDAAPQLPGDINIALKAKLEKQGAFPSVQRLFELYAWQIFLALNTTAERPGEIVADASANSLPRWLKWVSTADIGRADVHNEGAACWSDPVIMGQPRASERQLWTISPLRNVDVSGLAGIAGTDAAPLIDQNGNLVFYESLIDPEQVAYLCRHGLTTAAGQAAFLQGGNTIEFPRGNEHEDASGSFSVKLAWKIIDAQRGERGDRFFTMPARVRDLDERGAPIDRPATVGLVGMHIVHKTESSPQRIWATFEQVDNLAIDEIAHPGRHASFHSDACPICAPNQPPRLDMQGHLDRTPVQVARAVPIAPETGELNREAEASLARSGSVWQFYRLIGVQWPTIPSATPPGPDGDPLQQMIDRSGGAPNPKFLSNVVMETYVQPKISWMGVQPEAPDSENVMTPAAAMPPPHAGHGLAIVGESCMACHALAPVVTRAAVAGQTMTSGPALSGDFSWFLSQLP